ncbi:MAG: alpha/beta hydrolase [Ignavibacteria bacterium]|nr:alpha/beta hydrolase [Ignavibacteria bacterium]
MMVFGIVLLILILTLYILFFLPGYTNPIKDSNGRPLLHSITSLEKVYLGGKEQWILIRGINQNNPVILFLHGGPGTSDMGLLRRNMKDLEKHFVVVTWDQPGAGKSFSANSPYSSMNINRFVNDTHELTNLLCKRFNQKKIFLAGHSWGSVLGILSIQKYPELYAAYVGIGQIANMQENELVSYKWTLEQAKKSDDKQAIKKLNEIGKPPFTGDWRKKFMIQRQLLGKYGGELYGSTKGALPIVLKNLLLSPEYSLIDKVNFFRGIFTSVKLLFPELMTINLMKQALFLKVPVYFVLGKHDYEAPFMLAEQYFNLLTAPAKELIWFENSAHFPNIEENSKFIDLLINHILPSKIYPE